MTTAAAARGRGRQPERRKLERRPGSAGGGAGLIASLHPRIGNRAAGAWLQAKLRVGPADDAYEHEAERVAARVTAGVDAGPAAALLRATTPGSGAPSAGGTRPEGTLQRRSEPAAEVVTAAPSTAPSLPGLGPGQPLPASLRARFEPRFGHDFSQVRLHTGPQAAGAARTLAARAFTYGHQVAFGAGEYAPETGRGQRLLAHELAHVVQQRGRGRMGGPVLQRALIPAAAPLADFVSWTQRAIDDLQVGHRETLGPEVLQLLQGLRNHVSLYDASGTQVRAGGTFQLVAGGRFAGLTGSVPFELAVDDRANPPLGGTFRPAASPGQGGTLTAYAHRFRNRDHTDLGRTLFHEAVHALFHLRGRQPRLRLRGEAQRALNLTRHSAFTATLQGLLGIMLPGNAQVGDLARRLTEEILVRVETSAHEASVLRSPGAFMTPASYRSALDRYIFTGGHMLTPADRTAIQGDPTRRRALDDLLDVAQRYYLFQYQWRLRRIGISPTGIRVFGSGRPSFRYQPPPLRPPSFIPRIIESVRRPPF